MLLLLCVDDVIVHSYPGIIAAAASGAAAGAYRAALCCAVLLTDPAAVVAVQKQYMDDLAELFNQYPTPAIVQEAAAARSFVALEDLQNAFGGMAAMMTRGHADVAQDRPRACSRATLTPRRR
jgi:hypothetical protein